MLRVWATLLYALAVFTGNLYIVRELFYTEYTRHVGSIEAAYISLSRIMVEHWQDRVWWPLWYCGIPFQNTYPPLLHNLVALLAFGTGWSAALSHHAVTALMYCLGPVTLFFLAYRLSSDRSLSFVAALLYSVFSTSALLLPSVRHDLQSMWGPRRLHALLKYGEGPHVTSMTLLPLAILLLDLAVERRRPVYWFLAAIAMAAVVLTNWLGGFALAAAVIAWMLARRLSLKRFLEVCAAGVCAYLLASPWIPPTTLLAVRANAQRIGGAYDLTTLHLLYLVLACFITALAVFALARLRATAVTAFGMLFGLFMAALPVCAEYFRIPLLPQPERYHLEMEMPIAILFACAWVFAWRRLGRRAALALTLGTVVFAGYAGSRYRHFARELVLPMDMRNTVEWSAAKWFKENMAGRRVFAPGTVSFWMNAFTDTPQLMGGFDQGITNGFLPAVHFQLYSGMGAGDRGGSIASALLRAYGVHAVMVGGPHSREFYRPFTNPERYGQFPELWREGDDVIYAVPQKSVSMAYAVSKGELVSSRPTYATDTSAIEKYLQARDSGEAPPVLCRWLSWHGAILEGSLRRTDVLSIQISYHPGWQATVKGQRRNVYSDGLGLMVVDSACEGPCTVRLEFTGGVEMRVAETTSAMAFGGGVLWMIVDWIRRRRSPVVN